MEAQLNVKRNVQDLQDFVADMQQWKKEVKGKERGQGGARARQAPPPRGRVRMTTSVEGGAEEEEAKRRRERREKKEALAQAKAKAKAGGTAGGTAADHTYKNYQDKWDKFDLEAALASDSEDEADAGRGGAARGTGAGPTPSRPGDIGVKKVPEVGGVFKSRPMARAPSELNEPELGSKFSFGQKAKKSTDAGGAAAEEAETGEGFKERGNGYFRRGDWVNAEICYTNATILDPGNEAALANRAMARLKLENWTGAVEDATLALERMDREGRPPAHPLRLKVLQRRATARSHTGDGEGALEDLELATRLDPGSKALANDLLAVERGLDAASGLDTFTSARHGGYMPPVEFAPATVLLRKAKHDSSSLMI